MVRNEYSRFMQTLTQGTSSDNVRKVANLVLGHLDAIQPLSTYQGQRIKRIVRLAQANWDTLSTEITPIPENHAAAAVHLTRLKSLKVGPFRGFLKQEDFDLDSQLVLIYGPNGTGKTSFCEALEYGLLGNVAEAESKRFRQQDYLKNAHVGRYAEPLLEAVNTRGETTNVVANELQYRFCFVEKNRIDNFSRIAAQLPARQTELISTLFGLDSFNEFVRNFTSEIDERYIDLYGVKAMALRQKRQALAGSQQTIKDNTDALAPLEQEELALAKQYNQEITFPQLLVTLGNAEVPGEIATIESELQQPQITKTGLTVANLNNQQAVITENQQNLQEKEEALAVASESLSFKQLYEAVAALGAVNQDECPACKTPINHVARNPFELAPQELKKLAHLAQLQQVRDQIRTNLISTIKQVYHALLTVAYRFGTEEQPNPLRTFVVQQEQEINLAWWQSLFILGEDNITPWQHLQTQVQQIERIDTGIDQAQQVRSQKQNRLNHLRNLERQAIRLQERRKTLDDGIQSANKIIANFDEENKQLIVEVEAEKAVVKINNEIATAYTQFLAHLEGYRDALPGKLIADLGDAVIQLYNAFNRNDAPKDLLAGIRLPLAQGQRIEIAFQSAPDRYFDALHVLSEGHVRCIGLAILLAKNLKENSPLLIFDDPVNAIDDDHREGIRRTLFEDNFFLEKQIILTCHGEEFFKDIQNLIGAPRAANARNLTFLPQLGESHIRIDFNCAPRNYILAAQEHLGKLEIREALAKSRQALETLAKGKIWRYVSQYGEGNLSIKMRSATAPVELRNLTEQLKTKIAKPEFAHQQKDTVLTPLEMLLGINGDSREWRYLNKGTHEEIDRAEFDRNTVSTIVAALSAIDVAI